MIAPKIPFVRDGQILSVDLVNSMIARTEYVADLLRQYKLIAGDEMYIEPHFDGTRVSYLQQVAGGATPTQPLLTESEQQLEDLLNGQFILSEIDLYKIDYNDIKKLYGENARLWILYSDQPPILGNPTFFVYAGSTFDGNFILSLLLSAFFPDYEQGFVPPPPYTTGGTIFGFFNFNTGTNTSLQFGIGTTTFSPFD
jgi:hypothetical protein